MRESGEVEGFGAGVIDMNPISIKITQDKTVKNNYRSITDDEWIVCQSWVLHPDVHFDK